MSSTRLMAISIWTNTVVYNLWTALNDLAEWEMFLSIIYHPNINVDNQTSLTLSLSHETVSRDPVRVISFFYGGKHLQDWSILALLQGVSDPEAKRKTIGREFIENFKDFADSLEKKGLPKPKFLVQGTLYPDVIESCPPPGSGQKHSHTIKSHHNVGGLPKDLQFTLIEPLKELFKVWAWFFNPLLTLIVFSPCRATLL